MSFANVSNSTNRKNRSEKAPDPSASPDCANLGDVSIMKLWTYHPAQFRIDDPNSPAIDPRQGPYWSEPTLCYELSLHLLLKKLGTELFPLWCFTVPDCWELADVTKGPVEWELDIPEPEIQAFIRQPIWDAILKGSGDDWDNVVVKDRPVKPDKYISAVLRFPLSPDWGVICCGKYVLPEWRKEAEFLKSRDHALQLHYVKMYRDGAADSTNTRREREVAACRAEYLEEFLGLKWSKR